MPTAAIETSLLSKTYGATRALVELSLSVAPGQVFGFLGPNGAGKSTTIRMLLGLQRPSSGGRRCSASTRQADNVQIHRRVGYLPGELALYPRLTGRQHLDWFARAEGARPSLRDELSSGSRSCWTVRCRRLSKGNRQKIGLVLAFMHRPDLLILDEPTSGLDPLMQDEFARLVRETVAEGGRCSCPRTSWTRCSGSSTGSRSSRRAPRRTDTVDEPAAEAPRTVEAPLPPARRPGVFAQSGRRERH